MGPHSPDSCADRHVERLSVFSQSNVYGKRRRNERREPAERRAGTGGRISLAMPLDPGPREPAVALRKQTVDMPHDGLLELTVCKVDRQPHVVDRRISPKTEAHI